MTERETEKIYFLAFLVHAESLIVEFVFGGRKRSRRNKNSEAAGL
jgi:hypothetical protein